MKTFDRLLAESEIEIVRALNLNWANGKDLETKVLNSINLRETRAGVFIHETRPIHILAYILGYKQLETEHKIKITRSNDVPFPMTDHTTIFALVSNPQ